MKLLNQANLTTLTMMAIFTIAIVISAGLPTKAAAMPLVVSIPGLIMCCVQLFLDNGRKKTQTKDVTEEAKEAVEEEFGAISESAMLIWIILFAALLLGFGFVVGGPIIVTAFIGYNYRQNFRHAILGGIGTFVILYGVFKVLLGLQLFEGFIIDRLFG